MRRGPHLVALRYVLTLVALAAATHAQLSVVNPRHLEMPADRAIIILNTACLVVTEEFHQRKADLRFKTVLVLGDREERYQVDEQKGVYTLYLRQWDERKFTTLAMRFCIQQLATSNRTNSMVKEILRRTDRIGPVSVDVLRGHSQPVSIPPTGDHCYSATQGQPCPESQPSH